MKNILIMILLIFLSGCCAPMQQNLYQKSTYNNRNYNQNDFQNVNSSVNGLNGLLNNIKSLEQTIQSF